MKSAQRTDGDGRNGSGETGGDAGLWAELDRARAELKAANSELHSTVEELESTVAELRSTSETLEKVTAELESSTGDLRAIDEELRQRSAEIDESNNFVSAVLDSIDQAVIVVKPDLRIRTWNRRAQELWGLRARDVLTRPLPQLDIGLPVADLEEPLGKTLAEPGSDHSIYLEGTDNRSHPLRYSVRCLPLRSNDGRIAGAIIVAGSEATVS